MSNLQSMWSQPHKRFLLIAAGLHLLFFAFQLSQQQFFLADSNEYLLAAENWVEQGELYCGEWPPERTDYFSKRPPLFPFILIGLYLPVGSAILLLLIQNALSLFNLWLFTRILQQFSLPSRIFNFLIPFLVLYPAQMIYANFVMTELWLQACLLGMLWTLWQFWESQQGKYLLLYSALLTAAILLKPVMYLFALVNVFVVMGLFIRKKRHIHLATAALSPILTVLAVCSWNQARTGVFHYSSIQQINLLQYNAYYTLVNSEGAEAAEQKINAITDRADQMEVYAERWNFIQSEAVEIITANLPAYLLLHAKGVVNYFIDPGRFDLYTFLGKEKREGKGKGLLYHYSEDGYKGIFTYLAKQPLLILAWLLLIALANVVKLLALIRFAWITNISWEKRLLLLLWIGYLGGITGPLGASRFAVPLFPLMLLVLALSWGQVEPGLQKIWLRLKALQKKP